MSSSAATTESLRLFIALWPDAATVQALQAWADGLVWPAGARRTRPEFLHLTLHFLGATAPERVPEIAALLPAHVPPIRLQWGALQDWGQGLLVLRPQPIPPALADLQAELGRRLQALGLALESRPYRPHLTLARKATGMAAQPGPGGQGCLHPLVLAQSLGGYRALWRSA